MPGDLHFSFDRSVPLPILYLQTKNKQILNIGSQQNSGIFFTIAPLKTSTIVAIQCSQKRVLDDSWHERRFSTVIIYLMDPFQLNFITGSSSGRKNEPEDGYNDQTW